MTTSYKLIKWLILIIPTVTIGLWEYVRHEFLLSYVSMELGNILSPIIIFIVTMVFLTKLFSMMEKNQNELNEAKALQDILLEREKIAAELHDGIAQSLFLLNVQIEQGQMDQSDEQYVKLKTNIHKTNAYVREAITSLRSPIHLQGFSWLDSLDQFITELQQDMEIEIIINWKLQEDQLPLKEKIDLLLSIREALHNIKKHSQANCAWIDAFPTKDGWYCCVKDNGVGQLSEQVLSSQQFGIRMIHERANRWNWSFDIERKKDKTLFRIQKARL